MIAVLAGALAVAAINTAASRQLQRSGGPDKNRYWLTQGFGFAFRFAMIFGAAGGIWFAYRRMPEVVVFIVTAAVAQMVGQIYFLMRDNKPHA